VSGKSSVCLPSEGK